jgi:hypothetical protein
MENINYSVKNLDTGEVFDLRKSEDSMKINDHINQNYRKSQLKLSYMLENMKIKEKINTKFFKACERGDIDKINLMLNKNLSTDRKPNLNEKYLHDYTVLHVAITNSN